MATTVIQCPQDLRIRWSCGQEFSGSLGGRTDLVLGVLRMLERQHKAKGHTVDVRDPHLIYAEAIELPMVS